MTREESASKGWKRRATTKQNSIMFRCNQGCYLKLYSYCRPDLLKIMKVARFQAVREVKEGVFRSQHGMNEDGKGMRKKKGMETQSYSLTTVTPFM